jgi:hypothetical protein
MLQYRSLAGNMRPVSLVACCRQMFGFLHCFIGWFGRETGYKPVDRMIGMLWIVSGALFSRSSDSIELCQWLVKGYYALTAWDTYGHGPYADWVWDARGVLIIFSPTYYTSIQIVVTLGYEYHLFVAVITYIT